MSELPASAPLPLDEQLRAAQAEVARLRAERHERAHPQGEQARFHTVFEHSPLGHKIIDPDLTIRQANAAAAALLGLPSPLHLVGHVILEFVHPDYYADWARLQDALWAHHFPWFALETCLVRPDGGVVWCRVTSVLFPDGEGELGYTTLEDISARRRLEEQVQQHTQALEDANEDLAASNEELSVLNEELQQANTALEQLNAELDTFVYAAAHDLRLPITNLQGLVQALEEDLPAQARHAGQVTPILGMMQESMARFRHTLERLADFGTTRQHMDTPREAVDLAAVVEEVRQEVAPLLAASAGRLVVELAGTASLWFAPKHVYSVVLNLVSNALKYGHPDRAPVVHVRSHREPGRVVLRVQDNGVGLSEAQQQQLFRLFKRLHPQVEGMGMGLYLVKKILEQAGGSIRVESELGRGSTFIVVFPG